MAREIFVVARDRPDLYRFLSQTFADVRTVEVILDRRSGESREAPHPERRTRPRVEEELRSIGYAFIALP
jgi:hypothetical protein